MVKKEDWIYLAGLIDGDGSLSISITKSRTKYPSIIFTFQVRIGLKQNDSLHLKRIYDKFGVGRIYYSNWGKPHGIISWQSTKISDAILLAEGIRPYLEIKKHKCKRFIEAARFWEKTMSYTDMKRPKGERIRSREEITRIMKVALDLNYDRQTIRYRERKGWDYWSKEIERLYPR